MFWLKMWNKFCENFEQIVEKWLKMLKKILQNFIIIQILGEIFNLVHRGTFNFSLSAFGRMLIRHKMSLECVFGHLLWLQPIKPPWLHLFFFFVICLVVFQDVFNLHQEILLFLFSKLFQITAKSLSYKQFSFWMLLSSRWSRDPFFLRNEGSQIC